MKTSDSIAALAPALLKAQREIKDVVKDGLNPHFKSKYATLDSVIGVCKEALNANGIVFLQGGEETNGETLSLVTRLLHESGEWIESTLAMKPVKPDPQGIGSCITYARRYALAAICGVTSEDDDDGNAASARLKAKKAPVEIPKVDQFRALYLKLPVSKQNIDFLTTVLPIADFTQIKDCTDTQLAEGIDKINLVLQEGK